MGKGRTAVEELVANDSASPNIYLLIVGAFEHFRGLIKKTTSYSPHFDVVLFGKFTDLVIDEPQATVFITSFGIVEDVGWFDIPMADLFGM